MLNCVAPIGFDDLIFLEGLPVGDPSTLGFRSAMFLAVKIPEDAVRSAERFTQHKPQGCLQIKQQVPETDPKPSPPGLQKADFQAMADPSQRAAHRN